MARLNDLMPDVRSHLSGTPELMVLQYLRRAAKQFCQDSGVWEVSMGTKEIDSPDDSDESFRLHIPEPKLVPNPDFDPDSPVSPDNPKLIEPDVPPLVIPTNSYINEVARITLDNEDVPISGYSYDIVNSTLVIAPRQFLGTRTLEVWVTLEPSRGTSIIPDFLYERWGEGIADYCIWEMMSMINREWSSPRLAREYKMKYENRVAEATVAKARKGTGQSIELQSIEFI